MNNRQNIIFLLLMAVAWFFLLKYMMPQNQQPAQKQDPVVVMAQADKQAKDRLYPQAIKSYGKIAGDFKDTEYGAEALLKQARLEATAPGKAKSESGAVRTYRSLIDRYGKTRYSQAQAARSELHALQEKMDRDARTGALGPWPAGLYKTLDTLVEFSRRLGLGRYSYFFALLLITLIIKVLTWKFSAMQYKSMRDMQRVQPLLKEVQEKYKDKPGEMNAKVMEVYKREGVNPLTGCLPMLIQFPILFLIFRMISVYEYQFQKGIFLWINGALHARFAWIGGNLAQPDMPLVVLYTVSMFITQKLTVVDPTQAQQQKIMTIVMPIMFAFLFRGFASAFLLYWLMLNIVMTAHQYHVMKSHPPQAPPGAAAETATPPSPTSPRGSRSRRRRRR
jgi:YidC/Oxa1 family membrane protein insertase